jgi:AraC-like DNA-binding protein
MSAGESTIEAFEAAPVGKTVRGPTYLVWCVDASLCVSAIWGCPNEADVRALVRLCDVAFHPAMHAPYDTIIDVRGLKSAADAAGFAVLTNYLRERKQLKTRIRRQAILRPGGLLGAAAAGFLPVFDDLFHARIFVTPEEALAWLGRRDGPRLAGEVEERIEAARRTPSVLGALRKRLDQAHGSITVDSVARELGMSVRNLQRRLAEAGTSFRDEVNASRVRAAQRLMLETDRKITSIAFEVGCSSLQHLGALFRKYTGQSPRAFRSRGTS